MHSYEQAEVLKNPLEVPIYGSVVESGRGIKCEWLQGKLTARDEGRGKRKQWQKGMQLRGAAWASHLTNVFKSTFYFW
jgi:hypothetical protein